MLYGNLNPNPGSKNVAGPDPEHWSILRRWQFIYLTKLVSISDSSKFVMSKPGRYTGYKILVKNNCIPSILFNFWGKNLFSYRGGDFFRKYTPLNNLHLIDDCYFETHASPGFNNLESQKYGFFQNFTLTFLQVI